MLLYVMLSQQLSLKPYPADALKLAVIGAFMSVVDGAN